MRQRNILPLAVAAFLLGSSLYSALPMGLPETKVEPRNATEWKAYPLGGKQFAVLVDDSLQGSGRHKVFINWLSQRAVKTGLGSSWQSWISKNRAAYLKQSLPSQKTAFELHSAALIHRSIKKQIPRFSLDNGYEFSNAMARGERQCLLQSVLIASILQRLGMEAGVAMVHSNEVGRRTNVSHATTLLRLSDGRQILVDASSRHPFVKHKGLLLQRADNRGLAFVSPQYDAGGRIVSYQYERDRQPQSPSELEPLGFSFVRSQFEYYRGERTPGSLVKKPISASGLARSAAHFRRAHRICPENPLVAYMFGRTLLKLNQRAIAHALLKQAAETYEDAGWLPDGPKEALHEVEGGQP